VTALTCDDARENILLIWRHRFIVDQWDWEVRAGMCTPARTGRRRRRVRLRRKPVGAPRPPNSCSRLSRWSDQRMPHRNIYLSCGAEHVGDPEIDGAEIDGAEIIRWGLIAEAQAMITRGEIHGGATIIGVMHAAAARAASSRPTS
jgi:hypothetical protein